MNPPINPYAPPEAESIHPATVVNPPRRPASLKWLTFILGATSILLVVRYWQAISEHGAAAVWKDQPLFDTAFLTPVFFVLCIIRHRSKIFFYSLSLLLAWLTFKSVRYVLGQWVLPTAFASIFIGDRISEFLVTLLFASLFYKITFGLPSRTYFGITDSAPEEPPADPLPH